VTANYVGDNSDASRNTRDEDTYGYSDAPSSILPYEDPLQTGMDTQTSTVSPLKARKSHSEDLVRNYVGDASDSNADPSSSSFGYDNGSSRTRDEDAYGYDENPPSSRSPVQRSMSKQYSDPPVPDPEVSGESAKKMCERSEQDEDAAAAEAGQTSRGASEASKKKKEKKGLLLLLLFCGRSGENLRLEGARAKRARRRRRGCCRCSAAEAGRLSGWRGREQSEQEEEGAATAAASAALLRQKRGESPPVGGETPRTPPAAGEVALVPARL
jgi:hypothetical protein